MAIWGGEKKLSFFISYSQYWRRKRQPTAVFLPGKSHGWRSLVGNSHGVAESDMTEQLHSLTPPQYMAIHSADLNDIAFQLTYQNLKKKWLCAWAYTNLDISEISDILTVKIWWNQIKPRESNLHLPWPQWMNW